MIIITERELDIAALRRMAAGERPSAIKATLRDYVQPIARFDEIEIDGEPGYRISIGYELSYLGRHLLAKLDEPIKIIVSAEQH